MLQYLQFWNSITLTAEDCMVFASQYFHKQYGFHTASASTLRDLHSCEDIKESCSHVISSKIYNNPWISENFHDMFSRLQRVVKSRALSLQRQRNICIHREAYE
jgi:hypothetical protein